MKIWVSSERKGTEDKNDKSRIREEKKIRGKEKYKCMRSRILVEVLRGTDTKD